MRLGGTARYVITLESREDVVAAIDFATQQLLPYKVIGTGSNIIWSGDFEGVLLVNRIMGIDFKQAIVTAGAGEMWDDFVAQTVIKNLYGLEYLSLIPGTVGATPVQNVGAYGTEVQNTITTIFAYDTYTKTFAELKNEECHFAYRSSIFNTTQKDRYIITHVQFALSNTPSKQPLYPALEQYCREHNVHEYTPHNIREAVIAIRQSKLPDPTVIPNCGSFFKNPIIENEKVQALLEKYPTMPNWPHGEQTKLSAAWLIEAVGLKGYTDENTGMGTYEKQPLVIVNRSAKSADDVQKFVTLVINKVHDAFGIHLEREPELL